MSNYPPGTSAGDPKAPWNKPDPPECPECGNLIGDISQHKDDCPDKADPQELAEYWAEEKNHVEYDPLEHKDR